MKRRDFLNKLAKTTATGAGVVSLVAIVGEILPPDTESYSSVKIGRFNDFPINEFTFIPEKKIYLFRSRQHIRVLSAICTHLGCTIYKTESGFRCPCHGSCFDKKGHRSSGPASRPLDQFRVDVSKEGVIRVNMNKIVDQDFKIT